MSAPTRFFTIPNPELSGWFGDFHNSRDMQKRFGDCPNTLLDVLNCDAIPIGLRNKAFCECPKVPDNAKRLFAARCIRETPIAGGKFVSDLLTDKYMLDALSSLELYSTNRIDFIDMCLSAVLAQKSDQNPIGRPLCFYKNTDWANRAVVLASKAAYLSCESLKASFMASKMTHPSLDSKTIGSIQLEIAKSFLSD